MVQFNKPVFYLGHLKNVVVGDKVEEVGGREKRVGRSVVS
jgi:hypothetical protein